MDGSSTTLVLGGIFAILISGFLVVRPFFRSDEQEFSWELERELSALEKEKEAVFTTLNEIEFDFETNKLRDEDYETLKARYQRQAVHILKRENELAGDDNVFSEEDLEDALFKEINVEVERQLAKRLSSQE